MLLVSDGSGNYEVDGGTHLTRILQEIAKAKQGSIDEALASLLEHLTGQADAAIQQAIDKFAGDNKALKALLGKDGPLFQFLLDTHGGKTLPVPRQLKEVTDPLVYALQKSVSTSEQTHGNVVTTFGADGNAMAAIGVIHAQSDDTAAPAFAANDALLKFSLGGNIDLHGSFKVPFNGGSGAGSASVGAGMTLESFFEWPATNSVAGALVESVQGLCAPWDLDDVVDCLVKKPTAPNRGLREIHLTTTGTMQFTGSVGVGSTWGYSKNVGSTKIGATLGVDASISVGFSRSGTFDFKVLRAPAGDGIEVDIKRTDADSREFGLGVNAGLAITGLNEVVQPVVDRLFPDPDNLLADLKKWTAPGTLLIDALQKRLPKGDPALVSFENFLLGTNPGQNEEETVRTLIGDLVQEFVDAKLPFWSEVQDDTKRAGLVQNLASSVVGRFGIEGQIAAVLTKALKTALGKAVDDLLAKLKAELAPLATKGEDVLAKKLAPLAIFGEKVQDIAGKINGDAAKLLDPAIRLLTQYETIRKRVLAAVDAVGKLKLGLSLKAAYKKQTEQDSELRVRIRKFTPRTRMVYRGLMLGRLDAIWGMMQQAVDAQEMDPPEGIFTAVISRSKQIDFSVYFGDWAVSWQQKTSATAKVGIDANGMITLDSQATFSASATTSVLGNSDSATFAGTIDIAKAILGGGDAAPVTLGFALNYSDSKMSPGDVAGYLASVAQFSAPLPLLAPGTLERLRKTYTSPANTRLDIVVNLDAMSLTKLLGASGAPDEVRRIARTALAAAYMTTQTPNEVTSIKPFLPLAATKDAAGMAGLLKDLQHFQSFDVQRFAQLYQDKTGESAGGTTDPNSIMQRMLRDIVQFNGLAENLLAALKALNDARGTLAQAKISAASKSPDDAALFLAKTVDQINTVVLKGFAPWFKPPMPGKPAAMTIALLSTIAQLAGLTEPCLTPVLQIQQGSATPGIVAL